ncbi:hypothetical protein IWQ52_004144 [Labrenzia sp. EL_159]|nr:hypothetical protein [Labrenzia sp. EL_162]MBG6196608.1 hypothetical protein [Labrenzia sp. EL_159]
MTTLGSKKLFQLTFFSASLLLMLTVYANSLAPQNAFPGLEAEKLENLPLGEFYQRLLDLGFEPSWSYLPNQQAAVYSKDFWCKKTWIITWKVQIDGQKPIATGIAVQFINACD